MGISVEWHPSRPKSKSLLRIDRKESPKQSMEGKKVHLLLLLPWRQAWRAAKTLFFLFAMLTSLLLFSTPPLLVALLDISLSSAIYHTLISPLSLGTFVHHFRTFDFATTLVDLPLLSISRSLLILCVYVSCDGPGRSRGPYLGVSMVCSMASLGYVVAKVVGVTAGDMRGSAVEVVLLTSAVLAIAHAVVAYRTSCRERKKLLVYKIDLEAVSALKGTNKKGIEEWVGSVDKRPRLT